METSYHKKISLQLTWFMLSRLSCEIGSSTASLIGFFQPTYNLQLTVTPSFSLMMVLIGMLVGFWDLGAIILIFAVNAIMNLFGIMMEYHNQYTKKRPTGSNLSLAASLELFPRL
jgi:hypothetical protein